MYSKDLICNILNYIDNNLFTKISIDELANYFHYDKYYIVKLFKKEIGYTIISYINKLRIYYALKDINNSDNLFINISLKYGFYSLEYFSEIFKKEVGVSPRKYKSMIKDRLLSKDVINNLLIINSLIRYKDNYLDNRYHKVDKSLRLSIFK